MTQLLYASNGEHLEIEPFYENWLNAITFGWYPFIGYKYIRTKEDITFLIRILKNILQYNETQNIPENYNSLLSLSKAEMEWIQTQLLPFLEKAPELMDEMHFYKKFYQV